jgi:anti-sigma factor RsiW
MNEADDNTLLTGLIDGELDSASKSALEQRLAAEAPLRVHLAALKSAGMPFPAAFAALLDEAPLARMKAKLAGLDEARPAAARRAFGAYAKALAATLVVAAFASGYSLGRYAPQDRLEREIAGQSREDWQDAVAEYASLYTSETFAKAPTDAPTQIVELQTLGAKLGVDLSAERTKVDDLSFKAAFLLTYDGAALGQLAYTGPDGAPVLFCVIADARPDATATNETRKGFALTSWARDGRGYMVIARRPAVQVAAIADQLARRF